MVVERLDLEIEQTIILINDISYNNDSVIITISQHIENSGIVRTLYSGLFRHTQGHSVIFSHVQVY